MFSMMNGFIIFSGNSNPLLAKNICDYLEVPLGGAKVKRFSDGEIQIEIRIVRIVGHGKFGVLGCNFPIM